MVISPAKPGCLADAPHSLSLANDRSGKVRALAARFLGGFTSAHSLIHFQIDME
jgi:hypothetical protein